MMISNWKLSYQSSMKRKIIHISKTSLEMGKKMNKMRFDLIKEGREGIQISER